MAEVATDATYVNAAAVNILLQRPFSLLSINSNSFICFSPLRDALNSTGNVIN